MALSQGRYSGLLYRALNPVHARTPLSGKGAGLYGGRFNPKGADTLYLSLDSVTALHESAQAGNMQPTTLVSYLADLGPVFDTRSAGKLSRYDMTPQKLADPSWRQNMLDGQPVPTQEFAKDLVADGFVGMLVQSFAPAAANGALNLVLWNWIGDENVLEVIDDENRLGRT